MNDAESVRALADTRKELANLIVQEEAYWRQRAKVFWLKDGDFNTHFFHQSALTRRKANRIHKLRNSLGEWVSSPEELSQVVTDYFRDLFSGNGSNAAYYDSISGFPPLVSDSDNLELTKDFTTEEFKEAIMSMNADKSPGPDGFNPGFFQKFWGIVGNDVVDSCRLWLNTFTFPANLCSTNVVLIPKCESPSSMKDLRPISLCNVAYKILAKVLCNKLKGTLPALVDPAQSAFVSNRAIQDNILVAFETIHAMKNKRKGKLGDVALKIDISKAYDRVDWGFLEYMLRRLGFCDKWVRWMMMYVNSVSYNFVVNENLVGPIAPSRGLRQGDPLTPYLFIICTEGLSILFRQANRRGLLHGSRVCRSAPSVSHLLFADDCLLFCRADRQQCTTLKNILQIYERASGQAINFEKSGVFFSSNVNGDLRLELSGILGVSRPLNTGRYLGLPSLIGRQKIYFPVC